MRYSCPWWKSTPKVIHGPCVVQELFTKGVILRRILRSTFKYVLKEHLNTVTCTLIRSTWSPGLSDTSILFRVYTPPSPSSVSAVSSCKVRFPRLQVRPFVFHCPRVPRVVKRTFLFCRLLSSSNLGQWSSPDTSFRSSFFVVLPLFLSFLLSSVPHTLRHRFSRLFTFRPTHLLYMTQGFEGE